MAWSQAESGSEDGQISQSTEPKKDKQLQCDNWNLSRQPNHLESKGRIAFLMNEHVACSEKV